MESLSRKMYINKIIICNYLYLDSTLNNHPPAKHLHFKEYVIREIETSVYNGALFNNVYMILYQTNIRMCFIMY